MQRFAVTLGVLTFALVVLGGIVHNTGSSLACPDWPLCNGTAFPRMAGSILIEHGHRLTALLVVLGTLRLLVWSVRRGATRDQDGGATAAAGVALALVVAQALLGAITVKYRLPPAVSTAHLATSMLFFATVIYLAVRLQESRGPSLAPSARKLTLAAALLVYAQMVLGAAVRHLGAGLVCRDLVTCNGQLWPTGVDYTLQLHMAHRLLAVVVLGVVIANAVVVWRGSAGRPGLRALALGAPILCVVQMTLGILTIVTYRDFIPLTAHLGVAALLFADVVALHLSARGRSAAAMAAHDEMVLGVAA